MPNTRSAGARVRSVGPLVLTEASTLTDVGADRRGSVMAQLSHGPCFFVTVSSYVRRKLESGRDCVGYGGRGLPGGESSTDAEEATVGSPRVELRWGWEYGSDVGVEAPREMFRSRRASVTWVVEREAAGLGVASAEVAGSG